jgi:hypothetical protein
VKILAFLCACVIAVGVARADELRLGHFPWEGSGNARKQALGPSVEGLFKAIRNNEWRGMTEYVFDASLTAQKQRIFYEPVFVALHSLEDDEVFIPSNAMEATYQGKPALLLLQVIMKRPRNDTGKEEREQVTEHPKRVIADIWVDTDEGWRILPLTQRKLVLDVSPVDLSAWTFAPGDIDEVVRRLQTRGDVRTREGKITDEP